MPKKANMRAALYLLQLGQCIWCGQIMSGARRKSGNPAQDFATFEHLVPKSEGGKFNWSNILLACSRCNLKRNHEFQVAKNNGFFAHGDGTDDRTERSPTAEVA